MIDWTHFFNELLITFFAGILQIFFVWLFCKIFIWFEIQNFEFDKNIRKSIKVSIFNNTRKPIIFDYENIKYTSKLFQIKSDKAKIKPNDFLELEIENDITGLNNSIMELYNSIRENPYQLTEDEVKRNKDVFEGLRYRYEKKKSFSDIYYLTYKKKKIKLSKDFQNWQDERINEILKKIFEYEPI